MITEVSIRCQKKNPEVGIWRIPAYTAQYTTAFPRMADGLTHIHFWTLAGLRITGRACRFSADVVPNAAVLHAGAGAGRAREHALSVVGAAAARRRQPRPADRHRRRRRPPDPDQGTPAGNESAPIQLAQCRFPGLAIFSAKIYIQSGPQTHNHNSFTSLPI